MINGFKDRRTRDVFSGIRVRGFDSRLLERARNKLLLLNAAELIDDLRMPPSNRLERLRGDRKDAWSIRVNDQWRVCFVWTIDGPTDVELVDYH
jgi:proteic killer suppression protein